MFGDQFLIPKHWGSYFFKVGGSFYITRAHCWRPRGHFWSPKGHFWMPRGHFWNSKGHFWNSKNWLFDIRSRFWSVLEQGRQTNHKYSKVVFRKGSFCGQFGGHSEWFWRPKVVKKWSKIDTRKKLDFGIEIWWFLKIMCRYAMSNTSILYCNLQYILQDAFL